MQRRAAVSGQEDSEIRIIMPYTLFLSMIPTAVIGAIVPGKSCCDKAAYPLTRLGARRVALRRPRGRIKNRPHTLTM